MVHKLGYGNWDELKAAFRTSPLFRFDWFVKSRTTQELARRCDTLIRLVEKENQEFDERERQARKDKKLSRVSTHDFVLVILSNSWPSQLFWPNNCLLFQCLFRHQQSGRYQRVRLWRLLLWLPLKRENNHPWMTT